MSFNPLTSAADSALDKINKETLPEVESIERDLLADAIVGLNGTLLGMQTFMNDFVDRAAERSKELVVTAGDQLHGVLDRVNGTRLVASVEVPLRKDQTS